MTTKPLVFGDVKPTSYELVMGTYGQVFAPPGSLIATFYSGDHVGERTSNTKLFIDAVSTYNETGLTPSQLVEQRTKLSASGRALLAHLMDVVPDDAWEKINGEIWNAMASAIHKAEGG